MMYNRGQSRAGSLFEAIANAVIGMAIAFVSQEIIFTWYGVSLSASSNFQMVCLFTAISLVRSFLLRRLFNRITIR